MFTPCPPGPLAQKMSTRRSDSLISISMSSPASGITSTEAKEVWRRPEESKGEIRMRRWMPRSPLRKPYTFSPEIRRLTLLIPVRRRAGSPAPLQEKPCESAQRRYMRWSIAPSPAPPCRRAGVDFENGVGVILFGRKEQVGFRFFEEFGEALDLRAQRLQRFGGISAFLDFRAAGKLCAISCQSSMEAWQFLSVSRRSSSASKRLFSRSTGVSFSGAFHASGAESSFSISARRADREGWSKTPPERLELRGQRRDAAFQISKLKHWKSLSFG